MRQREYQFIFFLNISHSFYSATELGKKHSHTWELEVSMHPIENELVRFREAEQVILNYLERFQDRYLNAMSPFDHMNPSIENFLDYVAGDIDKRMLEKDWEVKELRISENPTRTYAIDRLRMDEIAEHVAERLDDVAEEAQEEVVATEESVMTENAAAAKETGKEEEKPIQTDVYVKEPKIVSELLVDTAELRIKAQTASNMTRIVITVP